MIDNTSKRLKSVDWEGLKKLRKLAKTVGIADLKSMAKLLSSEHGIKLPELPPTENLTIEKLDEIVSKAFSGSNQANDSLMRTWTKFLNEAKEERTKALKMPKRLIRGTDIEGEFISDEGKPHVHEESSTDRKITLLFGTLTKQ